LIFVFTIYKVFSKTLKIQKWERVLRIHDAQAVLYGNAKSVKVGSYASAGSI